jgi:hypothetical protein
VRLGASATVAILSGCVLLSVLGCTAQQTPDATKTPAAPVESATDPSWPVVEFGGQGELSESVAVPKGANSLTIEFACTDGLFIIRAGGNAFGDRYGACGGARSFTLPITHSKNLIVSAKLYDEDATFALAGSFIRAKTVSDAVKASECEELSTIQSSLYNAREGLKVGDVTSDDWQTVLEETRVSLAALGKTSRGLIGQQVPALVEALAGDFPIPDPLFESTPFQSASNIATQVCDDNGTPMGIMAEYGG